MSEKKALGRPSAYKPEYAEQAYKLALLGLIDTEMAAFFEVQTSTFNNWKKAHPDFMESLKRGKAIADADVAASLYHRARGYSHPEDKFFQMGSEIHVEKTIKHYPPDATSMIFWLKNRQPEKWRKKAEDRNTGDSMADAINKLVEKLPS